MTQNNEVGTSWSEIAMTGDWFVVTNENGGAGLEVKIDTPAQDPEAIIGRGHKLKHGEGITLNRGENSLYLRSTTGLCEYVVTEWASAT